MEEDKYIIVKMFHTYGNNVKDDICGFPLEIANRLIKAKICKIATKADVDDYNKKSKSTKKKKVIVEPK